MTILYPSAPVAIFLDDVRDAATHLSGELRPGDQIISTHSVNATIRELELLAQKGYRPYILSLDNDLGAYTEDGGEGYRVALWLAEQSYAHRNDLWADTLIVHSSNSVRVNDMLTTACHYGPYRNSGVHILRRETR